ncbi:FG-GAP-like repeat-containing protein [Leptolyngbya sp. CCNP1308]|uniref:FG-GAP-like repeat-containing protein n=1 Tax=Leptolyngbya sp. CCNP1308 TaxID=3110255 RepID=UPI002B1EE6EE|nr:FG-GAP-like repeat-containing protein [Leptolyngbya sp. CCNP1308]MEA5452143.1 FG-GAP-like repeat-containing protein [Leptolyngbya sp. CCNP1308]
MPYSSSPSLTQTTADIDNLAFSWEDGIPEPQGKNVGSLFGQYFVNNGSGFGFYGIAIHDYKSSPSQGEWQYKVSTGINSWIWIDIPEINSAANDSQFLLRTGTDLRFLPTNDYAGPAPLLEVNLIDSRVEYYGVGYGFNSGDRAYIDNNIQYSGSYTEKLDFQTLVYGVNDAPVSNLSVTFNQTEAIQISDRATATTADPNPAAGTGDLFPSVLNVQGLLGQIKDVSVTLKDLNIGTDNNLDIWLEGPQGQKIILLSDAGNGSSLQNLTLTFNNSGIPALAGGGAWLTDNTVYRPSNNTGDIGDLDPSVFGTAATSFNQFIGQSGTSLNGEWKLYIQDDTDSGSDASNFGKLLSGWSLTFDRVAGSFSNVNEDISASQELTVADLFGSHFSDVDGDFLKGVAIIENAAGGEGQGQGQWQYLSGNSWTTIATNLTEIKALLLTADTKVRFVSAPNFNGKPGSLVGRLIDSSHPDFNSGKIQDARFTTSGGPFSQATISKTLTINPVNDAPTVVGEGLIDFPTFLEDTPLTTFNAPTIEALFASSFQDLIDINNVNQNTFIGVAIVQDSGSYTDDPTDNQEISYQKGHWEVFDIRYGQWIALPSDVSETNAYLVPRNTQIRFLANANYNGEIPPLKVHLVDSGEGQALGLGQRINLLQTGVGGTTRYTADTVTLNGEIESVNDYRPWALDSSDINLSSSGQDEDIALPPAKTVGELFGPRFIDGQGRADGSDIDQFGYNQSVHGIFADASFWGILIKDVPASEVGIWEYSADGTDWISVSGWGAAGFGEGGEEGLYLPESYQLRFRQTTEHYNDQMTGTDLGPAHPLVAYLVDGSVTDSSIGSYLQSGGLIASADPIPNRLLYLGEVGPISLNGLTLEQAINAVNDVPTGAASISGTLQEDSELQAITSTIADADGLGTFSYQWQRSVDGNTWESINGATDSTFIPGDTEVGYLLQVNVNYTDGGGTVETINSNATASAIANVNDPPVGTVTIDGAIVQGQILTANTAILVDLDGLGTLSYQWQQSTDGITWSNIDGATDVTFSPRNGQVGQLLQVAVSYVDVFGTSESLTSAPTSESVQQFNATSDFNGDGSVDIFWRHQTFGQSVFWLMDNVNFAGGDFLSPTVEDVNWEMKAVGDLDSDGNPDLVWQHKTSNQAVVWLMDGVNLESGTLLPSGGNDGWNVVESGDFNGDDKDDILWRNANSGELAVWFMDGTDLVSGELISVNPGLDWEVGAVGDFTKDGNVDIFWEHRTAGVNVFWEMDGTTLVKGYETTAAEASWKAKGAADFNQDGNLDLLWHHPGSGENVLWLMDGTNLVEGVVLLTTEVSWNPVV